MSFCSLLYTNSQSNEGGTEIPIQGKIKPWYLMFYLIPLYVFESIKPFEINI